MASLMGARKGEKKLGGARKGQTYSLQAVCGLAIVYLFRVLSRHLGFAKRGELGRVKEGEEGGGVFDIFHHRRRIIIDKRNAMQHELKILRCNL